MFVNGCFWHHHAGCFRATIPKRNTRFWLDKFDANRRRDRPAVVALQQMRFKVYALWECEMDSLPRHRAHSLLSGAADDQ